jgi:hypothetical protein
MASMQVLGTDKALRLNNYNTLGLVQNFNWAPAFNAQDIFELGRTTRLDTMMELETSGSFEVNSAGNLAGILARMKIKKTGGNFAGFDYGVSGGVNGYTFNQDDLASLKFDIILHEKTEQTVFNRSTYLACCYPTTITGRVDANGVASDTVNWSGLYVVGFPSPYHDVRAVPCSRVDADTLAVIPTGYDTGWELAYVTIDGVPFTTDATSPVYATYAAGSVEMSAGYAVPVGAVAMALLYKTTPTTSWTTVHGPDTVGAGDEAVFGVRGFQANVYIAPADALAPTSSAQWLRAQSLDYTLDLRMETLRQIAFNSQGTSIYHRAPTYPLSMSVNVTVVETDWLDWRAMMNKTFDVADGIYQNIFDFAPQNMKREFAVVIDYFTKDGTLIERKVFNDLRVDGMGSRISVGGRGEITWTLQGSEFMVQGFNL